MDTSLIPPAAATNPNPPNPTPREREILRLLVEGRSDREIAAALSISPRTVMRHVNAIFTKLNVPKASDGEEWESTRSALHGVAVE